MGAGSVRHAERINDMNRTELATLIYDRLSETKNQLHEQFEKSEKKIGFFFLDDLFPSDIAHAIYECFPSPENMKLKKSLREYKYIAVQMNEYNPLLEESIYAFQDGKVVEIVGDICNISNAIPDENLYAGGISLMGDKQYLNPHLDNSHDKDRNRWRVLNLLYYVTPEWRREFGGNLEVWPEGVTKKQITIHSKFNRLVVMATHGKSWHSVSPIRSDKVRRCVSNYYFSESPIDERDRFHITTFRGRPEQKVRDLVLKMDSSLRMGIRKVFKKGIRKNPHVYKKDD